MLGLLVLPLACRGIGPPGSRAGHPEVPNGAYTGRAADGSEIALSLSADARTFHASGTIGAHPFVLGGASGWCGTGTLANGDGLSMVSVSASPDGRSLTLLPRGGAPLLLNRGGPGSSAAGGPMTGAWSAGSPPVRATLVQHGDLLGGVAELGGDAVGVSARVQGDRATGQVTWLDGTQVAFTATLAEDHLTIRGFGPPLTLSRR